MMVPPGVAEKWIKEFEVLRIRCLAPGTPTLRVTKTPIRNGSDFLRLLDDADDRRHHLIVLTHGALSARLGDPWVQLALVRHALRYQRDTEPYRRALAKWGAKLLQHTPFTPDLVAELLEAPVSSWQRIATRHDVELDDDPVPHALVESLGEIDLGDVRQAIRSIPFNKSARLDLRLKSTRRELRQVLRVAWPKILGRVNVRLPLLILDEAHHVKNDDSQLARLFANPEADADAETLVGPLGGMFERMLFLTTTPFQLGHGELLRVLERFEGAR
ncbi:MAG: hypothetical protein ACR2MB_07575 [Acidimicrobiales bacterium]